MKIVKINLDSLNRQLESLNADYLAHLKASGLLDQHDEALRHFFLWYRKEMEKILDRVQIV